MLNERRPDVKPDWQYIKRDETEYWGDKAKKLGKKFVATYAYNKNSETHCCSLTSAYWLVYLGTDAEPNGELSEEQNEELQDMILEADTEDASGYFLCSDIDSLESKPVPCNIDVDRAEYSDDEAGDNEFTNAVEADIRESFHANPW